MLILVAYCITKGSNLQVSMEMQKKITVFKGHRGQLFEKYTYLLV